MNQLVEQRHSTLRDGPKTQQAGVYQPFEVSKWIAGISERIFRRFGDNKNNHLYGFCLKL